MGGTSQTTPIHTINQPVMAAIAPEDDELMNLITWNGAKDLYGKAKGTGLFNLEQDLELQNLSPLNIRRNIRAGIKGTTLRKRLQNLEQDQDLELQNLRNPGDVSWMFNLGQPRIKLQNLDLDQVQPTEWNWGWNKDRT
jgi:hypothetical protein